MPLTSSRRITRSLSLLAGAALLTATVTGQCGAQWQPGDGIASPYGSIASIAQWDPDGGGPAQPVLVAGGDFRVGQDQVFAAQFDGSQWTPLNGLSARVTRLLVWNGVLFGARALSSGTSSELVSWNGTAWQSHGYVSGPVYAMAVHQNSLIVAGSFSTAGGVPANNIVSYDGASWAALGSGVTGSVYTLAVFFGSLYVGGDVTAAGGAPVGNLAIWNGTTWLGSALFNGAVESLAVRVGSTAANSYLYVGGAFTQVGAVAAQRIARSNGIVPPLWTAVGPSLPGVRCTSLMVRGTGINSHELIAGMENPASTQLMWRWNGSSWTGLGAIAADPGLTPRPRSMTYFQGQYMIGVTGALRGALRFDGSSWRRLDGDGIPERVQAVVADGNDLVIAGGFQTISQVAVNGVARGTANAWQPVGGGVTGGQGEVHALLRLPSGDLIAGGSFSAATGGAGNRIARWNGTAWQPLGFGLNGSVHALAQMANGDIVAGGAFTLAGGNFALGVARWNGSVWSDLDFGLAGTVHALAALPGGELLAGGSFLTAGSSSVTVNHVARWNGSSWSSMGQGFNDEVRALQPFTGGDVLAGGRFTASGSAAASHLARWNGTAWAGVVTGSFFSEDVHAMTRLPSGNVVVGGRRFGFNLGPLGSASSQLLHYHGSGYTLLDVKGVSVDALAVTPAGTLVAGGEFFTAGGITNGNVAQLVSLCPATAVPYGAGCAGTGGTLALAATSLPWVGTTCRATATGFSPGALAFDVLGFSATSTPLSTFHPTGGAGCNLLVNSVSVQLLLPSNGAATTQIVLPNSPAFIGLPLRQQVLQVQLDQAQAITGLHGSNGLLLTVGAFD